MWCHKSIFGGGGGWSWGWGAGALSRQINHDYVVISQNALYIGLPNTWGKLGTSQ